MQNHFFLLLLLVAPAFGAIKPLVSDTEIHKQCSSHTVSVYSRVLLQPRAGSAETEISIASEDAAGPRFVVLSPKLLRHIKAKKAPYLTVVYTLSKEVLFAAGWDAAPCLIDGMPLSFWEINGL